MENQNVWLVTGASKGLGLALVNKLLEQGYRVAATSRNVADLQSAIQAATNQFLPLAVDLVSAESVKTAIDKVVAHFGSINVIVNNAGYGLMGSLEELSDEEARANFNVNVFGTLNVIRNAMPHLRAQKAGHIFNVSSIGGFSGAFPGFGIYCATKFAVQGLSESLAAEVKDFGIKVTVVSPGYFRTNFLASDSIAVPQHQIDAYQPVRETQKVHQEVINGNQPGDPIKAAEAMIEVANATTPPLHLFLGQDAYDVAYDKIKAISNDLETWKALTTSTGITD